MSADSFLIDTLGTGEVTAYVPWKALTGEQKAFQAEKMAVHAAMVDRMDREIGRIVEYLESIEALDNTVIFILSDNGASAEMLVRGGGHDRNVPMGSEKSYLCLGPGWSWASNAPLRRSKIWVHEGGISTPLIVHWPDGIKAKNKLRRNIQDMSST
jgi:arylsulfatase